MYGASEGFNTLVVDSGGIGGQATSSSLIRNYLGFPRGVSGRRLAQSAYEQAWVFGAHFAFMQFVTMLGRDDDGLWVELSDSGRIRTRSVLLATGAEYQRIGIPELEELNGAGVYYGGTASEASSMSDREVYVVGGANSAGQAALHLARYAAHVTLVVRADTLDAGMSNYLVHQVEATPRLDVRVGTEVVGGGGKARLEHLVLRDRATGDDETVAADGLFLLIGARPHTGWLPDAVARDDEGFVFTGADVLPTGAWPLDTRAALVGDHVPGVLAAGDLRHARCGGWRRRWARVRWRCSSCTGSSRSTTSTRAVVRRSRPAEVPTARAMLKVALRGLLARKFRLALTATAVLLGVMFVTTTYVLTDTLDASFNRVFEQSLSDVDVVVRGAPVRGDDDRSPHAPVRRRRGARHRRCGVGARVRAGLRAARRAATVKPSTRACPRRA